MKPSRVWRGIKATAAETLSPKPSKQQKLPASPPPKKNNNKREHEQHKSSLTGIYSAETQRTKSRVEPENTISYPEEDDDQLQRRHERLRLCRALVATSAVLRFGVFQAFRTM